MKNGNFCMSTTDSDVLHEEEVEVFLESWWGQAIIRVRATRNKEARPEEEGRGGGRISEEGRGGGREVTPRPP